MLKEAIEKILSLDQTIVTATILGREYSKTQLHRVPEPYESAPAIMAFNTLSGFTDFANDFTPPIAVDDKNLLIHVESPKKVSLCGLLQPGNFNKRFVYATSTVNYDSFIFSRLDGQQWYDLELFVISLQSLFVATGERDSIIEMLGSLANESVHQNNDDGFSQSLQIKTGIVSRSAVTIKNPVTLAPYRTFREVEQPNGTYILRFKAGRDSKSGIQCSLWEADGGAWKSGAMAAVVDFIHQACPNIKVIA